MNKLIGVGLLAAAMAAPLYASAADVNWIQWTGKTGTLVQGGKTIDVAYTGQILGNAANTADYFTSYDGAYLSDEVGNHPGTAGFLQLTGSANYPLHHIHFSSAVTDPYLAIISLGQPAGTATLRFQDIDSIELISKGRGAFGDGALTVSGNVVSGREGNGVVQLNGTFTDLYFTAPTYEYWYGATFGVAAVPEPGTWGMLLAGGMVLGLLGRRRNEKFTAPR